MTGDVLTVIILQMYFTLLYNQALFKKKIVKKDEMFSKTIKPMARKIQRKKLKIRLILRTHNSFIATKFDSRSCVLICFIKTCVLSVPFNQLELC